LLFTGKDFVITDFEGSVSGPLSERRIKRSPLRDVAAMIRSLDFVARVALAGLPSGSGPTPGVIRPADLAAVSQWQRYWVSRVTTVFLNAYRHHPGIEALLPSTTDDLRLLLDCFLLERSLLEVGHQLQSHGESLGIVLESAVELVGRG
jgi:maltose alpha-D-glucosyltransferase/alpha-amylase